ncbi:MAG: PQQ-binding-like beta-propeller repeat protein [Caldisericia bacterium]|nr:PQQ-binding-like beta-propeller repeat protein [Caldisericia bacterium]
MRKIIFLIIFMFIFSLCFNYLNVSSKDFAESPWSMFMHDIYHTGRTNLLGPETPKEKFRFSTGDAINTSPVIGSDGTVYIVSTDSKLYAINPNGTEKWYYKGPGDAQSLSSPVVDLDGTIYFGRGTTIYAINPDGTLKWSFKAGGLVESSPVISFDGTIYFGGGKYLYALDKNGNKKWEYTLGDSTYKSSPAISPDGTIYIGSKDRKLHAVNPNGTKKWVFPTGNYITASPTVGEDGIIYIGSTDHKFYAIKPDGSKKWEIDFGSNSTINSTAAIGFDGTLYVGVINKGLVAINPNGTEKWTYKTRYWINSSPAIDGNGVIYIGDESGYLYAIKPDGTLKWELDLKKKIYYSSVAIGTNSTIYVGSGSDLYAFEDSVTPPPPPPQEKTTILLWIGNPMMSVNGIYKEIDPGRGTVPVIISDWGRTLLPIRAIVEELGGEIGWDGVQRKVTISFKGDVIELWIDNPQAKVNGATKWIDENNHNVKPIIINGRTMLPIRFVAENLGCEVLWDGNTRKVTIIYPKG